MQKSKSSVQNAIWTKAVRQSEDPQRTKHFLGLLRESPGTDLNRFSLEQARIIAALFSGSEALGGLLVAQPGWLEIVRPDALAYARRKQGLWQERDAWLNPLLAAGDFAIALERLREFKTREMLRIGARDLAHLGTLPEIIREISDVADVCLEAVWRACSLQLEQRYGKPYHRDIRGQWQPTTACVLGMGKLGGHELNYSSDVDVLFVYGEEGEAYRQAPPAGANAQLGKSARRRARPGSVPVRPTLANHQYFNRLAEAFIAEVSRWGPHGALYRIDLRLRPEGDSGPLTRSIAGYENYYAQWGQTWERMMLIKARRVAGDDSLAAEFLETVHPFRYPRSINESVLVEVGAMKDRIENEVVRADELERNVKLGRGGIREIEFIAQAMQLLHAGRQPFLQGSQTLPILSKLVQYELLSPQSARELEAAYCFLRDLEHRLQMENNQQTHTIPADQAARERLARLMGFAGLEPFEAARRVHTNRVRNIFESVLKREVPQSPGGSALPRQFEGFDPDWKRLLAELGFKDCEKAFRTLREFVEGPGYVHVSPRTSELALGLLPRIFDLCPGGGKSQDRNPKAEGRPKSRAPLSDPDRVITRLDNFIGAYGARATLFELWNSNPSIFELLLLLFDRSEFLAELAIRTPDLVDELVTSGRLRQRKSAGETLRDLRHGLEDKDQKLWLRRYHQAEVMRIGLRDILGVADYEQYLTELSALADACLRYALESVLRKHKVRTPPFVIIGLGKLGGSEIDYGSDLDILFVAASKAKNVAKLKPFALEVLDLLSTRTEQGLAFHTDARLRPDGEKGLLVNTLGAYEEYYRRRAMLWEIQTLTRTRPIAGNLALGEQFQAMAARLTNFAHPTKPLAAYREDWKSRIHQMRLRIETERTPRGQDDLAIKTGSGGLMDAEFIAQTLCLEHGWQEPNTLKALERAQKQAALPGAEKLIENYRQVRRIEGILRRWSYEGETVLPADPAPFYRVAVRCGFASAEDFREAVRRYRHSVRDVYNEAFGLAQPPSKAR
jgi:glutamate-ammonia-ligase adenylyltransferase